MQSQGLILVCYGEKFVRDLLDIIELTEEELLTIGYVLRLQVVKL